MATTTTNNDYNNNTCWIQKLPQWYQPEKTRHSTTSQQKIKQKLHLTPSILLVKKLYHTLSPVDQPKKNYFPQVKSAYKKSPHPSKNTSISTNSNPKFLPPTTLYQKKRKPIIGGYKSHHLNNVIVLSCWHWVAKKTTAEEDNRSKKSSISYSRKFSVKLNKSIEFNNIPIFFVNP